MKFFKKFLLAVLITACLWLVFQNNDNPSDHSSLQISESNRDVLNAIDQKFRDVQVSGTGKVTRILSDDNHGARHQRFILRISPEHTVLITHNIDLAPRIAFLRIGDVVQFYGVYEWNTKGGIVHWTHHDPDHRHIDGWLVHNGREYR